MIRPEDARARAERENEQALAALEARIDAEIATRFRGERALQIDLVSPADRGGTPRSAPRPEVLEMVVAKYREGGWAVVVDAGEDQREGPWCTLTLRGRA